MEVLEGQDLSGELHRIGTLVTGNQEGLGKGRTEREERGTEGQRDRGRDNDGLSANFSLKCILDLG